MQIEASVPSASAHTLTPISQIVLQSYLAASSDSSLRKFVRGILGTPRAPKAKTRLRAARVNRR